jgi:hypothetical protein
MTTTTQQEILRRLAHVLDLSGGIRAGQLMAHLDFLAEDMFDHKLADIDDEQLLQVIEHHELELTRRHSNVA